MYRRYRTGMTAVDVAQIEERRPVAQLLEQDAIGPHAQGAFQQLLGRHLGGAGPILRSEEHTSELQSLMRISYAVFCLKKKKKQNNNIKKINTTNHKSQIINTN